MAHWTEEDTSGLCQVGCYRPDLTEEQAKKYARDKTIDDMMLKIKLTRMELNQLLKNEDNKYYWLRSRGKKNG